MCKGELNVYCLKVLLDATEVKTQNNWIVDARGRKTEKPLLSNVLLKLIHQKIQKKLCKEMKKEAKRLRKEMKKTKRTKLEIVSFVPSESLKMKIKSSPSLRN